MGREMGRWLARLTGGRPMHRNEYAFTDTVSGESVWRWTDRLGRRWLAAGAWSLFRVETFKQENGSSGLSNTAGTPLPVKYIGLSASGARRSSSGRRVRRALCRTTIPIRGTKLEKIQVALIGCGA